MHLISRIYNIFTNQNVQRYHVIFNYKQLTRMAIVSQSSFTVHYSVYSFKF